MSNGTFDFNAFIQESKEVLVNPKSYFSTMKTSGGMTEPLIKALIYGAIAGAIAFLWSILGLGGGILGSSFAVMTFISYTIGSVIGLFIGGVVVLIISSICKGSTDFEANVRVTAALMVMMPVSAFLAFATHFNLYLGLVLGIAVNIFALWLLYNALVESLKAKPETSKIVLYILIALIVLISLMGLRTKNQLMKGIDNSELKEMLEQQK